MRSLSADVLVVGAGITGVTTAWLLKQAGLRVILLERDRLAAHDSGHTTAHLTCVTDKRLHSLVDDFGRKNARAVWRAGMVAIDEIERLVREENISCEFTRVPGYLHEPVFGVTPNEGRAGLKKDSRLAVEFDLDATYLDRVPFMNKPGVRFANQAKFHPVKFLTALAAKIPGNGSGFFEESEVKQFDAKKRRAKVNGHWISYGRVVLATNNPLLGESRLMKGMLFQTKLAAYSSYVIGARIPRGSMPIASFWDTNDPYRYLRVDQRDKFDYAIFGGEDHKTGQARDTEGCFQKVSDAFLKLMPSGKIDHRWSGQVILTNDGLPYIGPNEEDQFIATGANGNGYTFGVIAALMACDWVAGRENPWRELFDPYRKKIRGGLRDLVAENKDYPYYLVRDWFRPVDHTVRSVRRGEGKILKLNGKRVAVSRDSRGRIRKRSAVCTHMGCIVRWNAAEKTWDCPCHGSRFATDGKVLAGPTETPLGPA